MSIIVKALATARLTRLFTQDTLPEWLIIGRMRSWSSAHEIALHQVMLDVRDRKLIATRAERAAAERWLEDYDYDHPETWQARLISGLDCPFCIGFWVGAAILLLPDNRLTRWILGALALNYVVGHVSSRIDDAVDDAYDEE